MKKLLAIQTAVALALAAPMMASAESNLTIGSGDASARLNFRVVVPRVLYLGVGTGAAALADNTTVDNVVFDYSSNATAVGTGAAAASITGATVPVRVLGNNGGITLTSTSTAGGLSNGAGDSIAWTEITATSDDATNFDSPAPSGGSFAIPVSAGTRVTARQANWTFSFANSAVVAPGTYAGTVTYTASMP